MTIAYIISQVFITLGLGLQGATYFITRRNRQLVAVIFSNVCTAICFAILGAYVATAMNIVAIARDVMRRAMGSRACGWGVMWFWVAVMTVLTAMTARGAMSVLPYFSMLIFTIAIWQPNLLLYRAAGLITNTLLIIYHIYIGNAMGAVLQTVLLMCAVGGLVAYIRDHRVVNNSVI